MIVFVPIGALLAEFDRFSEEFKFETVDASSEPQSIVTNDVAIVSSGKRHFVVSVYSQSELERDYRAGRRTHRAACSRRV